MIRYIIINLFTLLFFSCDHSIEALYNLSDNPLENPNLLNANQLPLSNRDTAIKTELTAKLAEIIN